RMRAICLSSMIGDYRARKSHQEGKGILIARPISIHRGGYLRLVNSTASSVIEPRASTNWPPSGDQLKEKMCPSLKSVNGVGGPPESSRTHSFETTLRMTE